MADELVRVLNGLGYTPIFMPETGLQPPELWNYSPARGQLVRRGALSVYLPAAAQLQPVDGEQGNINYKYSSSKKLDAAVSFLENSLKCIGIDAVPKLDLGFAGSHDFAFAFTNVTYRRVDPARLDVSIKDLSTEGIPRRYVEEGNLHIAYQYAYAHELLLSRGDKRSFSSDISGKVGAYIDIGAKGSVAVASETTISFKGKSAPAAFAYKAGRLERNDNRWEFFPEEVRVPGLVGETRPYVPQRGIVLEARTAVE
jgi:hypothetical protein